MASPLKLAAVVTLDTSQVGPGVQTSKQAIAGIGTAADTSASQIQKLIDQQLRISRPAANINSRGDDIAAYGQQLDQLRAKYNPLFAVISNYKTNIAEIRDLNKKGALSADEMTQALSRQRQAALGAIDALKGRSPESGPAANFRRTNLTYQLFDIFQGGIGGQPAGMIAAQQLPQIAQIYAGQGGVNAALKDFSALASGASKLITPVTVGVGGLTAALAIGGKAWGDYLASTKEVETASAGLGRAVAGTQASMEASARAGASSAGISVSSARSMEAAFLRTGKIGSENFEKLISISKDFGATIGTDSDAAGQALAEMFADPEKAAQTLYQQYGLIDAATARQATNLARQNRQSEAQAVLLDALPGKLASAAEATTALGRAWDSVATAASNAWDALGRTVNSAISGPSLEDQRALADARYKGLKDSWFSGILPVGSAKTDLDSLNEQIRKRDEDAAARQKAANDIRLSQAAVSNADVSPANSSSRQIEAYRNSIAAMRSGLDLPGTDETQRQRITTAIAAQERALDALINKQANAAQLDRLDIQIQNERNPLDRAELEARRTRLQLSSQEISTSELEATVARERNKVIQETLASYQVQATDMQAEIEIRSKLTAQVAAGSLTVDQANTQLQTELQLRPLILAAAKAEGAEKEALLDTITKLRAAYEGTAEAQRNANAASYISDQQRNIDRMRFQTSIAGRGTSDQSMQLAQYDAEAKIRELGASSDMAAKIRANAVETEKWNQQLSRTTDAWNTIRKAEEDAIDSAVDKLSSGDLKGALDDVLNDAKKTLLQLGVTNPLKNALTGSNYGTISDVGGLSGVFKQMVGGGQSVASMAVTAGTVMINGGVSAGVGNLLTGGSGLTAANNNGAPVTGSIASYITQAALKRGIDPNVALNVAKSEGGLNSWNMQSGVFKNGVQEPSFGPFQLYMGGGLGNAFQRKTGLDPRISANGPAGVDFALDYAKQNGWGSWYGAARTGIGNWDGINKGDNSLAFSAIQQSGTKAVAALNNLAAGSQGAAQNLGVFGSGLGQFGQNLGGMFNGAGTAGANSGGLFGSLIGGTSNFFTSLFGGNVSDPSSVFWRPNTTFSSFLTKGFDVGGYTGHGGRLQPAGVVHKGEVVWSQDDVRRAGGAAVVEGMRLGYRGYDRGGVVGGGQTVVNASNSDPFGKIEIHNYSGANVQTQQTTDERGARQTKFVISDTVGDAMGTKGGGASKTLSRTFGVKRRGISR